MILAYLYLRRIDSTSISHKRSILLGYLQGLQANKRETLPIKCTARANMADKAGGVSTVGLPDKFSSKFKVALTKHYFLKKPEP